VKSNFILYLKGIGMGAADIVPGVSGGTIALITGIYEELISSIKNINPRLIKTLFKKGVKEFWIELNGTFFIILLSGIATSVILLVQIIVFLLDSHEFKIWGFFFGLIIASAYIILKDIQTLDINKVCIVILGIAIAASVVLSDTTTLPNTDIYIFFTGSIAITAMILPGISGSFILLLLSKYEFIINAIKDFDIRIILVFGLGCIFGLLIFSRFLHFLFQNYKDNLLALLSGFLIGSLLKVWPFRQTVKTITNSDGIEDAVITQPVLPTSQDIESIAMFIIFSISGYLLINFIQKKSIS
jgi:putative membrane protein|tara:strand:+ start:1160 stop:2059 length:900 start_codon:yes stop_codon:yes gene_type:complete